MKEKINSKLQTHIFEIIEKELKNRNCSIVKFCEYSGIKKAFFYVAKRMESYIGLDFLVRASLCLRIPLSDFFRLKEFECRKKKIPKGYRLYTAILPIDFLSSDISDVISCIYKNSNSDEIEYWQNLNTINLSDNEILDLCYEVAINYAIHLENYLKNNNLAFNEFSEITGCSKQYTYTIKNKITLPTLNTIERISLNSNIYLPYLFSLEKLEQINLPIGFKKISVILPTSLDLFLYEFEKYKG